MKKSLQLLVLLMLFGYVSNAQVSGNVFRDYNGNGIKGTSSPNIEPNVAGIIVNAYNDAGTLLASFTTGNNGNYSIPTSGTYNGTPGSNTGGVPSGTKVRIEFIIPSSTGCELDATIDYSTIKGSGATAVQFVTGGATNINFGINNPADYNTNTNPDMFMAASISGNPLAASGTATTDDAFIGFPYTSSGNTPPPKKMNGVLIGSCWGVAYSKQAGKIFTAAFIKRHAGLGTLGSGGIYILTPGSTNFTAATFYDMDANGYRTRASSSAPAYGQGTSYNLTSNDNITFLGSTDPLTGLPSGLGVVGTNANRNLPSSNTGLSYDPAAFEQTGKVGLGDIEISDDGKFLFVTNLYERKIYRLELNDAYNPTSVVSVTSYSLPATTVTNGVLRPFGLRFQRGKLYVGAVATGENGGTAANLRAYVFALNSATGAASFAGSNALEFPLNYAKGPSMTWTTPDYGSNWRPWANSTATNEGPNATDRTNPTPILSDIEFDERGTMIVALMDRSGNQYGENTYKSLKTSTALIKYAVGGDYIVAKSNCNGTYTTENNGSYTASNGTTYTSGSANNQGIGNSEFFKGDAYPTVHEETGTGALAYVLGRDEVYASLMDPTNTINSGGVATMNMTNGTKNITHQLTDAGPSGWGKANSLGDLEVIGSLEPVEIGNRVWNDANANGIQDPSELPIANVTIELYSNGADGIAGNGDDVLVGTSLTSSTGEYYFNNSNVADGDPLTPGAQVGLKPGASYNIRVGSADWTAGSGTGDLANFGLTMSNVVGTGAVDYSDNDAVLLNNVPNIPVTIGQAGQNNHNLDIGFTPVGSIGNFVFTDANSDGLSAGDVGINGVKVYLYKIVAGNPVLTDSTITAAGGAYNFPNLISGDYQIGFPLANAGGGLTIQTSTATTDGNSDANPGTGLSPIVTIDASGSGQARNNTTIDAGYLPPATPVASVGNFVFSDANGDGSSIGDAGVDGLKVYLYSVVAGTPTLIDSTTTAGGGAYSFDNLPSGDYQIGFPTSNAGGGLTTQTLTTQTDDNSDANTGTGLSPVFTLNASGTGQDKDNTTIDAGYLVPVGSIGNYVWNDLNSNGINDEPSTAGINGVKVYLMDAGNSIIDSTFTANDGLGNPGYYLFPDLPSATYYVQFPLTNAGNGITTQTATAQEDNNSDANPASGISPAIVINAAGTGQDKDNTTIDAGYVAPPVPYGSIGNYVWYDNNQNGLQDEPAVKGINGLTVYLLDGGNNIIDSTITSNDGTGIPGYYLFDSLVSGTYKVRFPTSIPGGNITSVVDTSGTTDGNNNASQLTGESEFITIDANGTGVDKDNMTIDAGYFLPASIGNIVWLDNNKNGIQDAGEPGVAGITVTLFDKDLYYAGTAVTDAYGHYKFEHLAPGDYAIQFTPPSNYVFTTSNGAGDNQDDFNSDADTTYGLYFGTTPMFTLDPAEYDSTADCGIILPTPPTATVGNYVWLDTNQDGLQDANEKGISGVVVTLYNAAGDPVASTITDANGEYLFTNVTPGNGYTIHFTSPIGYLPSPLNAGSNDSADSDLNPLTNSTAPFNVAAGDDNRTFDAGFYPQAASKCALGNKVWYDANNDGIQDPTELGVQGVTVYLLDNSSNKIDSTVTNTLGEYVFNNLDAGTYAVQFEPTSLPVGYTFTTANAGTNDAIDGDEASNGLTGQYTLVAGERNMTVDAGVYNASNNNSLGDKVWLDANKDGIQDANEVGVQGVTVTLYDATTNAVLGTTTTNKDGNYRFDGLPDGSYYVGFSNLPNGMNFTQQNSPTSTAANGSDANISSGKTSPVTLTGGMHNPDLDAGIYPQGTPSQTASLGNRVWFDINNNGIQDIGEPGVQNAIATLLDAGPDGILGNADDGASKYMYTDANGEYLFTGLPAGNYAVEFSSFPQGYTSTANNVGDDKKDSDIPSGLDIATTPVVALGAGEENLTLDAGIYKGVVNNIGNYVWYDTNKDGMQDANEIGVKGIQAILLNPDGSLYDFVDSAIGVQPYVVTTDENGFYLFTNLPDGSYKVQFGNFPEGYQLTQSNAGGDDALDSDADTTTLTTNTVSVSGGQTNLTLDAGIYSDTRAALGNYIWMDTNRDGIQDANEDPIAGVLVTLYDNSGNALATTVTDANGQYMFTNLLPGTYSVGFTNIPDGTEFTTQNVDPLTGSDVNPATGKSGSVTLAAGEINTSLDAGVRPIEKGGLGNYVWYDTNKNGIQDASEIGVAGVTVTLKDASTGDIIRSAITNGDGYYLFPNLDPSKQYTATFSGIPQGYSFTQSNGTITDPSNSDANVTTGITSAASVPVNSINPNVDAGIIKPLNTIGNYVWLDNNKDGIQDAGEPGVANIPVSLFLNGTDGLPGTTDDILVASTSTDAYGKYLFTNLPDGDYNVGFTLPSNYEWTSTTGTSDTDSTNSDANITTGRTGSINLAGGETELDVDAGIIFSTPPALSSLGDYVWYDTNGDGIQDANESPIAGVTVTLYDAATGNVLAITTTNAKGDYLFNDLPNGDYQVGFSPKPGTIFTQNIGGTTPGNTTTNSDANATTGKTGTVSIIAAGTVITGLDAGFKDDPKASLGDLVWIDLNHDGMQDAGEPGVPGVTMTLYTVGTDGAIGGGDDILVATTTTDANGNYLFSNLDPAKYFVTATPVAGYTITTQDVGTDDLKDNDFGTNAAYAGIYTSSQIYNLLAGQNYPGVDMGIYNNTPGLGSLGDKVWFDLNGDGVQDPSEYGVEGVNVSLLDGTGNPVNNPATGKPYILQTDANGNYLFIDLPAGNYQVAFSNIPQGTSFSPTGSGTSSNDSDPNPATGVTAVIALSAGQHITDVDAGIVPGIPSGKGSLGNLVWIDANNDGIQDAGEQGVPGVSVNLYADANGDGLINGAEATTPVATKTTDAQGFYMFTGLDAGTYQVSFVTSTLPSGYAMQTGKNDQGTNDALDSDPNPTTGLTGLYNLAQGEDNLTVDAGIYNPSATNSVGDKVWLDQNADGIQDANEPGVPGVAVSLLDASGEVIATIITDADGNYHFGNLPNGTYSVQVAPPVGFNVTTQNAGLDDTADSDIDPTSGTTASVTLVGNTNITDLDAGLTTTRAALGNYVWLDTNKDGIQDAGETGVPGVTVLLTRPGFGPDDIAGNADDSSPVASAITDGNGYYFFSNLEPGTYDVQFTTIPSGLSYTTQNVSTPNDAGDSDADPVTGKITGITLVAGQVDPTNDAGLIPLELGSVGDIAWFDVNQDGIRDANEAPVPGTTVTLKDALGNVIGTAITDGTGHFLFTDVPAGTGYTLTFGNLPTGASITAQGVGPTSTNSDADPTTGVTAPFSVSGGQKTPNIDAGITLYIPLPVALENFNVTMNNCKVAVSWTTTSEQNVSHFTLMRKGLNESNFKAIAQLKAAGNVISTQHYHYNENSLANGDYVYYISTVDIDHKQYASEMKSISLDCKMNEVSVFPNPATDQINIRFNSTQYAQNHIIISDITGKVLLSTDVEIEPGTKVLVIPVANFAQGIYHVRILSDNKTETFKVSIAK